MKIEVLPDYSFALKEVYSGVLLVSRDNEEFGICMRDSGFEFQYAGVWYEAKGGVINTLCGKPLLECAKNKGKSPLEDCQKELFEQFERQAIAANYPISFSKSDGNRKYFYSLTQSMFDGWLLHYRSSNGGDTSGKNMEETNCEI